MQVKLVDVGALTAVFTWSQPDKSKRNGEVVAYHLHFNSPDWLGPREMTVEYALNYTLTGKFKAA